MFSHWKSSVWRVMLILMCLGVLIIPGCAKEEGTGAPNRIDLYGLFPTSGTLSSQGKAGVAAFELAVSDINSFLNATGSEIRVTAHVVEMGSDTESAVKEIAELQKAGVPLLLTHISSSQLEAALDDVNAGDMVLLTSGSSSPALAIPGDNIIRLNQNDADEAHIAAKYFQENGYTRIVPIVRDDVWGRGLVNGVSASLPAGTTMDEGVRYGVNTTDFSGYVSLLDRKVGALLASADPDKVVVYAVSFEELDAIMKEAAGTGYGNLSKVSWFGSDGNVAIPGLAGTSEAAEYALARNFVAIEYAWDPDTVETSVVNALKGPGTTGYTMGIYDGTWIAFNALLIGGKTDSAALKDAVRVTAAKYHGICENYVLDKADDKVIGIFDFYGLSKEHGTIQWNAIAHVGIWGDSANPDNIGIFPVEQ